MVVTAASCCRCILCTFILFNDELPHPEFFDEVAEYAILVILVRDGWLEGFSTLSGGSSPGFESVGVLGFELQRHHEVCVAFEDLNALPQSQEHDIVVG